MHSCKEMSRLSFIQETCCAPEGKERGEYSGGNDVKQRYQVEAMKLGNLSECR